MAQASAAHLASQEQQNEHWRQRLERAHYEVDLARRQYDAIDPANRLVARELERRWEAALEGWSRTQTDAAQAQCDRRAALSDQECAELRHYAHDLGALWQAPTTCARDKKRIVRCLIENVVVSKEDTLKAKVHWHGGEVTHIELPAGRVGINRYVTEPQVVDQVHRLAEHFADDQIALILHHRGMRTPKGLTFRAQHVTNLRRCHKIAGHTRARLETGHVYSARQAAKLFAVSQRTLESWLSNGLLRGSQLTPGAPWRIEATPADRERLCPQEMPSGWMTLKRAAHELEVTQQTVLNKLKRGELESVRVRTGGRTAWRVQIESSAYDDQQTLFT